MTEHTTTRGHITRVREAAITYRTAGPVLDMERASTPAEAAAYFRAALPTDDAREHFAALALDTKHHVLGHYLVSVGTLDAALVHPREIFRFAVLSGAASIVIGHTHPSGNPTPSTEDLALTRRMIAAGDLIGIPCVDHVIIGCNYGGPMPAPALSIRETMPGTFTR